MKNTFIVAMGLLTLFPVAWASPIRLETKKTVVFIYAQVNATNLAPDGTGFLVGIPSSTHTNRVFGYLVTAKHVVCPGGHWLPNIFVRVNRRDGSSEQMPIPIITGGPAKTVFVHDDPTVDIAVTPFVVNPDIFDFLYLPPEFLTTTNDFKNLGIQEGSEVFFPGMFVRHLGTKQNLPIIRFGKVSMFSDEKINWFGEPTDLYLIEANAYGGNSGAPVFFSVGIERPGGFVFIGGGPTTKLAGVLIGHFTDSLAVTQAVTQVSNGTNYVVYPNNGIATVVPSYHLSEILYSTELNNFRAEVDLLSDPPPPR